MNATAISNNIQNDKIKLGHAVITSPLNNAVWLRVVFIKLYPLNPTQGGWSLSQLSLSERRGAPWTGRQSITGPHRDKRDKHPSTLTLPAKDNLETPINLTCMFLGGGRKPEYPERTHAYTGRTCKLIPGY